LRKPIAKSLQPMSATSHPDQCLCASHLHKPLLTCFVVRDTEQCPSSR
jgi:hypothetical protein